jgi:hypothetical protein
MAADWVLGWLEAMCQGGLIPPFCVELVLRDSTHHHLHSIVAFERETQTMCARVWDFRAFEPKELEELKKRLNGISNRNDLSDAQAVHPKLDWANLHLHFEDVAYCVEWHDRLWPEADRPQIGFSK